MLVLLIRYYIFCLFRFEFCIEFFVFSHWCSSIIHDELTRLGIGEVSLNYLRGIFWL